MTEVRMSLASLRTPIEREAQELQAALQSLIAKRNELNVEITKVARRCAIAQSALMAERLDNAVPVTNENREWTAQEILQREGLPWLPCQWHPIRDSSRCPRQARTGRPS